LRGDGVVKILIGVKKGKKKEEQIRGSFVARREKNAKYSRKQKNLVSLKTVVAIREQNEGFSVARTRRELC